MDTMAGLDRLRTCLLQIDTSAEISDLILYKYGNRIIQEYASNRIITTLTSSEETEIREKSFVVKCFCHSEIYVAWQSSAGFGNSKYYVSKSELLKFEESSKIYTEVYSKHPDRTTYIFRNESGIKEFFVKVLGLKKQAETK